MCVKLCVTVFICDTVRAVNNYTDVCKCVYRCSLCLCESNGVFEDVSLRRRLENLPPPSNLL